MLRRMLDGRGRRLVRQRNITPWYLSGGVPAGNCLGAYQAIGANSLADSYINLANPGVYNLTPNVAPTWDVVNGWKSAGAASLNTGITGAIAGLWSIIIRLSNSATSCGAMGVQEPGPGYLFIRHSVYTEHTYYIKNYVNTKAGVVASGVLAICGNSCFLNGVADGSVGGGVSASFVNSIEIFGCNQSGTPGYLAALYVQAAAIYNIDISSRIASVSAAMAALPQ